MKTFLLKLILFSSLLLLILEGVFRVFLPAADRPMVIQFEEYGIQALDRNYVTSGQYTIGRSCRPSYHWNVNNDGFNSAIDFSSPEEQSLPCAVVIGNSFSLGLYSDVEEHLAGRLHTGLSGQMEVYNLGMAGMPFSQVPLVVRFAEKKYEPKLIIIQTSARSVPFSLKKNGRVPYCQQYSIEDGEVVTHPPLSFEPNRYKYPVLRSALVRYLLYNANYNLGGKGQVQAVPQVPKEKPADVAADSADSPAVIVLDKAMREISSAAPGARVLVVHDADRASMYETGKKPARLINSAALEQACRKYGFDFLDMTDYFWQEYGQDNRKFNFDENYHWNPYGVSVVAEAVLDKLEAVGVTVDHSDKSITH